ncbi:MAG: histidine phosphatase family protein [Anaerolineales bacterium]|nr:histidine phosphatase family protein [Anaerolineales bacterium]
MKKLLIFRHAKSSWKHPELADHDRPLNKRGKRDAPRMGELMREHDMVPDLIISSTAKRARQTADFVADTSGYQAEIQFERSFYAAEPEALIDILQQVADNNECVMVVGHNPDLEELLEMLTGDWERMPTAALALIELAINEWARISLEVPGKLVDIWRPRELG